MSSKWLTLYLAPILPLALALTTLRAAEPAKPAERAAFHTEIRPLLQKYCFDCHGAGNGSGGVSLAGFPNVAAIQRGHATWRSVLTQIRERSMPPRGMPQPTEPERQLLTDWLAYTLDNIPDGLLPKDPGHVVLRRLSRTEYNNTVRDLFGVDERPADGFPVDGGGGGGFDNNADTLFLPPILMERYLEAAGSVLEAARPQRLFVARPGKNVPARTAAKRVIAHWAPRAFRRPVTPAEIERPLRLFDLASRRGESYQSAVRFALKALLISPNFLFRAEADRPASAPYPVSDYELASRLSYFLWSSMPDDALFRLAAQKKLRDPEVLEAQIRRMLRDPKAAAFADDFAGQWLRVRDLKTTARPDPRRYPEFTPALRDAMYGETVTFFHALLREDRSLLELLDADYTFVNEDLAGHYGIPGVKGRQLRRVRLADNNRGGVLTQAAVLTVTSYPQRTSPVLRGKWVLEELLGTPPPPPPPGAGGLPASDAPKDGMTLRQRLEMHRDKPECASCHQRMDPLGFGLENFDAVGRWRTEIAGAPVDAAGTLATGETFRGPADLKKHLLRRKDDFLRNLAEKMLAYALGRGIEPGDAPALRKIVRATARDGYRSTTLVREIISSYPFQYRRNTPPPKGKTPA